MRAFVLVALLAAAACGDNGRVDDDLDAGPSPDGGPQDAAVVAPDGGLGLYASCDPLEDECGAGLTCRIEPWPVLGQCEPVGPLAAGGDCTSGFSGYDGVCGLDMACMETSPALCVVICDPVAPLDRCSASQTCIVTGEWGEIGGCVPP